MDLPPNKSIQSLTEKETILPCVFKPGQGTSVVQITWLKKTASQPENIITAHNTDGQTGWVRQLFLKKIHQRNSVEVLLIICSFQENTINISSITSSNVPEVVNNYLFLFFKSLTSVSEGQYILPLKLLLSKNVTMKCEKCLQRIWHLDAWYNYDSGLSRLP